MVPASARQLPKPIAFAPVGRMALPVRRNATRHLRHGFVPSTTRRVWTCAQKEDQGSSVASSAETMQPYKATDVTDANWEEEVIKSPIPVLVDFWAPWCGPCKMIGPTLDELIDEAADKFKVVKVNTDDCPSIATEYGIRSIPTCMIFKNGKKVDLIIGAVKKTVLKSSIEKFLT